MPVVRIQAGPFDTGAEIAALLAGRTDIGGIGCFLGTVRGTSVGRQITAMTLEHYPGMTERALATIATQAEARWPLLGCIIIHRIRPPHPRRPDRPRCHCQPASPGSPRQHGIPDRLAENKGALLKHEEYADGQTAWVEAKTTDDDATARWLTPAHPPPQPVADESSAG